MKSIYRPFFNWYTFSGSYLNLRFAVLLFAAEVLIGTMGFVYIEQYDWLEAFYMTIITVSTVGYTEVQELSDDGRLFTSILILVNIAIFAYIVSAVTSFLVKGEFFRKMHINVIDRKISELEQHIILCGYGRYGKEVAEQFLKHDVEFVLIEKNHDRVVDIQRSPEKLLYIEGDATNDDVLVKAGIDRAKALLTTLSDDTSNVFTVLSARQMNPALNIISRASSPQSGKKLELAGSNQVIMPDQIGGFYMATMVNKPGTVEFFAHVTNEFEADIGFEEIHYETAPAKLRDCSIRDWDIRDLTGANVIGYKPANGQYVVNPGPEIVLDAGASFIVLGNTQQLERLRHFLNKA